MTISHLSKAYSSRKVLDDLTLTLPDRGIIAIMGSSGCGKTTLFQLLAGLTPPDSGTLPTFSSLAYAFQEPRLLPWRTVLENVRLARNQKSPAPYRAEDILTRLGLSEWMSHYPGELSGGMAERVSLARALYADAQCLLLDEPFRELDQDTRLIAMETVRQLRQERGLTLFITHDPQEALFLADSILSPEGLPLHRFRQGTRTVNSRQPVSETSSHADFEEKP